MRRRDILTWTAGALLLPGGARGQQHAPTPVVGFLTTRSQDEAATHTAAFLRGLNRSGYNEGQNVGIEYRWASGRFERLGAFAAELAALPVSVLVAGGDTAAVAAKTATSTIPVIFMVADDPVRLGLVSSFNLPNSNATGISLITSALGSKRLELIREMVPNAHLIGLLVNPNNPSADSHSEEVQTAAHSVGLRLMVFPASTEGEFEGAFEALRKNGAGALVLQSDPFLDSKRAALIALALRYAMPAVYHIREFPNSGGLLSYGPSLIDGYGQLGSIVGRVLKGGRPHDIPVARPTRFELVINLKTAKALNLTIPPTLLARADEVIE